MKYNFIHDMVDKKVVELKHCSTLDNIADIFTKGIAKAQFLKLRDCLVNPLIFKGEYVGLISNI